MLKIQRRFETTFPEVISDPLKEPGVRSVRPGRAIKVGQLAPTQTTDEVFYLGLPGANIKRCIGVKTNRERY